MPTWDSPQNAVNVHKRDRSISLSLDNLDKLQDFESWNQAAEATCYCCQHRLMCNLIDIDESMQHCKQHVMRLSAKIQRLQVQDLTTTSKVSISFR